MLKELDGKSKEKLRSNYERYKERLERFIAQYEAEALAEEPAEPDYLRFKTRQLFIREFLKIQEEGTKELKQRYWRELKTDHDRWPTQWMLDSKKISTNLKHKKILLPVLNYLARNTYPPNLSRKVANEVGAGEYTATRTYGKGPKKGKVEEVRRDWVMVRPLDLKTVAKELDTSPSTVHRYLKELVRWGILRQFGKLGQRGKVIYSIGYYLPFGDEGRVKPIYFLTNTKEMRTALSQFLNKI